jgi:hypothetical protein
VVEYRQEGAQIEQLEIDAHPTSIETIFALVDRQVALDTEPGRAVAARRLRRAGTESA